MSESKKEMLKRMASVRSFIKKKTTGKYKHVHKRSASSMAKGSIRSKVVKKRGSKKTIVRVGCPKGTYSKKSKRCRVGMKTVSILKPNPKPKTFRVFVKKSGRYAYLTPENAFDTNFTLAEKFYKETAVHKAKTYSRSYPSMAFGVSDGKA